MKSLITCLLILLVSVNAFSNGNSDFTSSLTTNTSLLLDQQILDLQNQYRKSLGLDPLLFEPNVYTICQEHSNNMAAGLVGYGFEGLDVKVAGILGTSEVAYQILKISSNNPKDALNVWLNAANNRNNIESKDYNYTAIAVSISPTRQYFYTQIFLQRKDDYVDYTANMTVNQSLTFNEQILDLINQHRAKLGLQTLAFDKPAYKQCESHSKKMAKLKLYLAHKDVEKRYEAIGKYHMAENVAMNRSADPKKVVDQWLNSPGHRTNIETPDFNCAGISAELSSAGDYYYTMIFVNRK